MRYLGSKNRIASKLLPIILKDRKPGQYYVELFCGGCNMIDKVENPRIAADVNPLLISMWKDFQAGRIFPSSISRADYDTAYASYKFRCGSYRSVPIPERSIVYLDPPYRNTTGYRTEAFDYDDFYYFCFELWEQGHTVFISEYSMPIPFKEVLSIELSGGIKNSNKAIEKLYTL